ncbi:flagellar hook-basal body complex protein FliE [Rhizorhapis sp.]|uniref:flagellar hook-basal body complex protein FliE n=1 Tax=Rhizorhapis sp. TaxID=1968842 RepID=UPI002B47095C|nr:flagellar hook-basal body complex protein FliE [Rhizorhapis sp.]HKR17469.1 flagellar hook-basal body complex protein FliE [Rhizorhapis sp.]
MTVINTNSVMAMRAAILQQNAALREASSAADVVSSPLSGTTRAGSANFGTAMKSALSEVNALQNQSSEAAAAYERGETTDIAAVMLAKQQASIGFEATLQVRNKLLSAYKDIMSMPV